LIGALGPQVSDALRECHVLCSSPCERTDSNFWWIEE